MLDKILKSCETEWIKTKSKKNHPFRWFTLSTVGTDGLPQARIVVLRHFDAASYTFTLYTDQRTPKVKALQHQQKVELLFFDAKKWVQIRVGATLKEMKKNEEKYQQQHEKAQKDYTTKVAPGTKIKSMDAIEYGDENHFYELIFEADTIDYLKLKRPNHQRAYFERKDQKWEGSFVAP